MKKKKRKPTEKKFLDRILGTDRDTLLYQVMPRFLMEIMAKYFRVEIIGTENIPRHGRAIIAPNHSGVSGFDAMLLSHEVWKASQRRPRVLTHHLWFLTKTTALPANRLGFIEATMANGVSALNKNQMILIFPEGESGNFKPSSRRYHLQEFRRGFIRMALQTGSPIVPTIIIGAEETHINLSQLELTKYLRGLVLPLPLNVIPLPSKWKIIFLEPIKLPYKADSANDRDLVLELAEEIQEKMQERINIELAKRESIFL